MYAKILITAAAAGLLSTAAYAQQTQTPQPAPAAPADQTLITPAPADTSVNTNASTTAPLATAETIQLATRTELVTNGPVPDTPATRSLYPPMSRAGKRTAPAGN